MFTIIAQEGSEASLSEIVGVWFCFGYRDSFPKPKVH